MKRAPRIPAPSPSTARTVACTIVALGGAAWAARAGGGFEIGWFTMDGGGGSSGAAQYELSGTIGQPDAGVLSGAGFELAGGFWSGGSVVPSSVEDLPDSDPAEPGAEVPLLFQVHGPRSNPVRSPTDIRFDLPAASTVRMELYSVTGSRVSTLVDAELAAGAHVVAWDGRTEDGVRVRSGVYFLRTSAGPWTSTRKMTVLE